MIRPFSSPPRARVLSAAFVTSIAFWCYHATLLPGLDLGDTASLQTGAGALTLTPRDAYPLYHALGSLFVWLSHQEAAHALNLASAVCGALACGVTTWVAAELVDSTGAGIFAGLLLAFSYTFWSQSIIAEVYPLHMLMISSSLAALLAWSSRPGFARLAAVFAVFALGFGNHLSMILLLPGLALFLLFGSGNGPHAVLQPRNLALALGIAAFASLQYAWNFAGLWRLDIPPATLGDALGRFWFDVTKTDWRSSFVLGVSETDLRDRPGMYWFDIRQQFGLPGVFTALFGSGYLLWTRPLRGLLVLTVYAANLLFALTYNVGDTHVFLLPSHLAIALFAACGVKSVQSLAARISPGRQAPALAACLCVLYPAWRGLDTYPAVDRSDDHRAEVFLDALTKDLTNQNAVFGADLDWQVQNTLDYYTSHRRTNLSWFLTDEVLPHLREFVDDNAEIDRQVVVTPLAVRKIAAVHGDQFQTELDPRVTVPTLDAVTAQLPAGALYALALLRPYSAFPINEQDLRAASLRLSGGLTPLAPGRGFTIMVGATGGRPILFESRDRPFRVTTSAGDLRIDIRMESWLPTDTMRRAGFGHVIVNHRHAFTLERGISFVAIGPNGRATLTTYAGGLLAPQPRYILGDRR